MSDEYSEDHSDRDLSPTLTVGEGDVDVSLRPRSLGEFIGQARVREQLQLVLESALRRRKRKETSQSQACTPRCGTWKDNCVSARSHGSSH